MIPGPRPSQGQSRPEAGLDRGHDTLRPVRPAVPAAGDGGPASSPHDAHPAGLAPVALARSSRGWAVISPAGADAVSGLVEGLTLADLVAEEFGELPEPDRTARRSARGPGEAADEPGADPMDARVAALERTVAQLEHALAARVSTERAIGVLAERHGTTPRSAFETLRREARSQGRPVADLAREVLDGLHPPAERRADAPAAEAVIAVLPALSPVAPISHLRDGDAQPVAAADGRS